MGHSFTQISEGDKIEKNVDLFEKLLVNEGKGKDNQKNYSCQNVFDLLK